MRSRAPRRVGVAAVWLLALLPSLPAGGEPEAGAPPCQEIGSAEAPSGDSGIGGSGRGDDSGIGGTGIYGVITDAEQLCVNGLRVHFDEHVPITVNGRAARDDELALGQVVWVTGDSIEGRLQAGAISVVSAVVGPIAEVSAEARRIEILREVVWVPPHAHVIDFGGRRLDSLEDLAPGEVLDVFGLRRADGLIVASRVERRLAVASALSPAPRLAELLHVAPVRTVYVEGYVGATLADGFQLEGLRVELSPAAAAHPIGVGAAIRFRAEVGPGNLLRADQVIVQPPPAQPIPVLPPQEPPQIEPPPAPGTLRPGGTRQLERP